MPSRDARIVVQDVNPAESLTRKGNQPIQLGDIRDVYCHRRCWCAGGDNVGGRGFGKLRAHVGDHDRCPLTCETERHGAADPARRSGDDRHLALQTSCH